VKKTVNIKICLINYKLQISVEFVKTTGFIFEHRQLVFEHIFFSWKPTTKAGCDLQPTACYYPENKATNFFSLVPFCIDLRDHAIHEFFF
jgi:hypothetical protein